MSTQRTETKRLPRPHAFTPPNLTLRLDAVFQTQSLPLVGRYAFETRGRATPDPYNTFPDLYLAQSVPAGIRGYTSVSYVHTEAYNSPYARDIKGLGFAFLHEADVAYEPFGVALATVRAVTNLIARFQPVNARDIGFRIGRYLGDVEYAFEFTPEQEFALMRALGYLQNEIDKCQPSK